MSGKQKLAYGQWPSQISPERTGGMLELSETTWNETGDLFWRERNSQQGSIYKATANGSQITCVSGEINVGGGLFYGGGSFGVSKNWVVFVDGDSQQLIRSATSDGSSSILTSGLISSASPTISSSSTSGQRR